MLPTNGGECSILQKVSATPGQPEPSSQNAGHTAENLSLPPQFFPKSGLCNGFDLRNNTDISYTDDIMASCNIRNMDGSLLRALKIEALKQELTLRDYVLGVLAKAVGWQSGQAQGEVGSSEVQREPAVVRHVCAGCGWEMQDQGYCPNCQHWNGEEKPKGLKAKTYKRMTAKEFMELSPSEQMRAKREGKF